MNILVTGSMGFIGSHFMDAAKSAGHKVLGIDKKAGVTVSDLPTLRKIILQANFDFDMIVHLAATCSTSNSLVNPGQDFGDNTVGTFVVAELARMHNVPVIYTSTVKAEPLESGMRTPYGLTKFLGEQILMEWNHSFGVEYVINRPGTIYGPRQEGSAESGWLGWFIKASIEKRPITIFGDGKQTRDVLFVSDYIALLLDQVENFDLYKGHTFEVGGGAENAVEIEWLLHSVLKYTNYNFDKERKGDSKRYVSGNRAIKSINGWEPKVGYMEGIKLTVDGYGKQESSQLPE